MRAWVGRRWAALAGAALVIWLLRGPLLYLVSVLSGAAAIALLLRPVCAALEKRMPRPAAILAAWIGVAGIAVALAALLVPPALAAFRAAKEQFPLWAAYLKRHTADMRLAERLPEVLQGCAGFVSRIGAGLISTADAFGRIGLMWMLSLFLLLDWDTYALKAELMIPLAYRKTALIVASRIGRELGLFLRGQLLVGAIVGALSAVGLALAGISNAGLLGAAVGALNLIPYFGPVLGAVPVVISAWGGGVGKVIGGIAALFLVQQLDGMWISPRVMSGATGLTPVAVLTAMAAGGCLMGIFGMLLAIPAAVCVRIIAQETAIHRRGMIVSAERNKDVP